MSLPSLGDATDGLASGPNAVNPVSVFDMMLIWSVQYN